MSFCSNIEVRRCRPLLGTFVEITATGLSEPVLQSAANDAFTVIERIHRLMSVHDPESELSLVNREAHDQAISVSPETYEVLHHAAQLSSESKGAFDSAVAPTLAQWRLLPETLRRKHAGDWRHVRLLPGRKVRFLRPLALDLGGIAKGFAVDQALEVLRAHGVASAVVNAGGDLRVFGSEPVTIHLRHPSSPHTFARTISLQHGALATSSPCFTEGTWRGRRVSHLVNPQRDTAITGAVSVTVLARECWLADALTKVVLNTPDGGQELLPKYGAEAIVLTA